MKKKIIYKKKFIEVSKQKKFINHIHILIKFFFYFDIK